MIPPMGHHLSLSLVPSGMPSLGCVWMWWSHSYRVKEGSLVMSEVMTMAALRELATLLKNKQPAPGDLWETAGFAGPMCQKDVEQAIVSLRKQLSFNKLQAAEAEAEEAREAKKKGDPEDEHYRRRLDDERKAGREKKNLVARGDFGMETECIADAGYRGHVIEWHRELPPHVQYDLSRHHFRCHQAGVIDWFEQEQFRDDRISPPLAPNFPRIPVSTFCVSGVSENGRRRRHPPVLSVTRASYRDVAARRMPKPRNAPTGAQQKRATVSKVTA